MLLTACQEADAMQVPASLADLAIGGDQLVAHLGRTPGPWVATTLARLLGDVAHHRVANVERDLLAWCVRIAADGDPEHIA